MRMTGPCVLATIMLAGPVSCSVKFTVSGLNEEIEKSEIDMGTHHVVVKPGNTFTSNSSSSSGATSTYRFSCGDTSVTIRNEELTVNAAKYGTLDAEASILIDHDKVFVNGEERHGTKATEEEILASAPVRESTKQLAGYDVTVRPGASFTSNTSVFGTDTFTVGEITVTITGDVLSMNDVSYGSLTAGDKVLVEFGRVYVSGQLRSAAE